jgi:hypothetical protein
MTTPLNFNDTQPYSCKYEGIAPLVRTGTVDTNSIESFCNALLLSCSKKFITSDEDVKHSFINKLQTDFNIKYRESQSFSEFFNSLETHINTLYEDFFNFVLYGTNVTDSLTQLLHVVFSTTNDDEENSNKTKLNNFQTIFKNILSLSDFKKVVSHMKRNAHSLNEVRENLISDFQHFIKFKIDKSSQFLLFNAIFLVKSIFDVVVNGIKTPNFNNTETNETIYDIASNHFQINIFILQQDKLIYNSNYESKRKSVVLLLFDNNHYEIVGKLRQPDIINRQFLPHEDVIQSMLFSLQCPQYPLL